MTIHEMKVPYEEIAQHVNDDEWSKWPLIQRIESTIPKPDAPALQDWKAHVANMLNNYFLEKKVKEIFHLEWYGNDHEDLHCGAGFNVPDFRMKEGFTVELKQRRALSSLFGIKRKAWHNADYCLAYIREEGALYEYHIEDGTVTKIMEFSVPRVMMHS